MIWRRLLFVAYAIIALSPALYLVLSQYEGWLGIFRPETTEWLCGRTGRFDLNPFDAAALGTYYLLPTWLLISGTFGVIAWKLVRMNGWVVLALFVCGAAMGAFMLFGAGWMSDRYEHVLQRQCEIYG